MEFGVCRAHSPGLRSVLEASGLGIRSHRVQE